MTRAIDPQGTLDSVLASDPAAQSLGLVLAGAGSGRARLEMVVRPDMANRVGICHGGFIFAAADSACAFACMTKGEIAVVQSSHITFSSPAQVGDWVIAEAAEVAPGRRGGTYDARVTTADGRLLALVRGQCRFTGEPTATAA